MSRRDGSEATERIFTPVPDSLLITRLGRELGYAGGEIVRQPVQYLRNALLPASFPRSLSRRLVREVGASVSALFRHPVSFVSGALSLDEIGFKRWRRFLPILAVSAFFHGVVIVYIVYRLIIAPLVGVRMVERPYQLPDFAVLLKPLHYPPGMLRAPSNERLRSLEEIRELEKKRREEAARREQERKEKEEEARKAEEARKDEEARKAAEAKEAEAKKAGSSQFGDINVTPMKDIIGKIYDMTQAGEVDLHLTDFTMMASFKIDADGTIPASSIKLMKSSGSSEVDRLGKRVIFMLGESGALKPLSILSSNTIKLEINDTYARLSITSFAPTPEDASRLASQIGFLLGAVRFGQRNKNPAVAELLSHLTLKSDNKRVDADLRVSRARAAELMQAQFGKPPPPQ